MRFAIDDGKMTSEFFLISIAIVLHITIFEYHQPSCAFLSLSIMTKLHFGKTLYAPRIDTYTGIIANTYTQIYSVNFSSLIEMFLNSRTL